MKKTFNQINALKIPSTLKHELIINKQKKLSLETSEKIINIQKELKNQTREALQAYKRVNTFYLIKKETQEQVPINFESLSSQKLYLLLIASVDNLHISEEKNIREYVLLNTENLVDVTVILLKKSNWHLHIPVYHSFFRTNLTEDKLWIGSPLVAENPDLETYPLDVLKQKYWLECKSMIKPIVKRLSYHIEGCQSDVDIFLYKYALQQLAMTILFLKMDYIPQVHSIEYLWRLLKWYAPELDLTINCDKDIKAMLFDNFINIRNYPNIKFPTKKYTDKQWTKVFFFITKLYDFTKECYLQYEKDMSDFECNTKLNNL